MPANGSVTSISSSTGSRNASEIGHRADVLELRDLVH